MPAPVYTPTDWVDLQTVVSEANMDKIEQGIKAQSDYLAGVETRLVAEEVQPDIPPVVGGQWLRGSGSGMIWSAISQSDVTGLTTALAGKEATANKAVANGYASLDSTGVVPLAQLPAGAGTSLNYRGSWSAALSYAEGDVVVYNGVSYMAMDANTNSAPVPWATSGGGGTITRYYKYTEKDVVSTTALTDLFNAEITIAAGVMSATGAARIIASGDYKNSSGGTTSLRVQLKLGTTIIWDALSGSGAIPNDGQRTGWYLDAIIQNRNLTNSQHSGGLFMVGYANVPNVPTVGTGGLSDSGSTINAPWMGAFTAVNTAVAQPLAFSCAHGASSSAISMRLEQAMVEVW